MALTKVVYTNGVTVITGENLNEIQDAIIALEQGGGGTSDYNDLTNKPSIGGVTLSGNKSLSDIGAIAAPASPATGDFLCWDGSAWAATTVPIYNGGSY